jgi:hypothetical protein
LLDYLKFNVFNNKNPKPLILSPINHSPLFFISKEQAPKACSFDMKNYYGSMYLKMQHLKLLYLTADEVKNRRQGFGLRPLTTVFHPVSGFAFLSI